MMAAQRNLTDRAHRYRAQQKVTGPKKCVICGSTRNLDVMHLDGNEAHGEPENLAYGCRSCNNRLSAAFKRAGKGVPTNQYNPAKGGIPTFEQYMWAVTHHSRGAHDEGGVVIHATPKSKRIEYARRIADAKAGRAGVREAEDRWNPTAARNPFEVHKHYTRRGSGPFRLVGDKTGKSPDELNAQFLKKESRRLAKQEIVVDLSKGSRAERELEARNERAAREGRRSNPEGSTKDVLAALKSQGHEVVSGKGGFFIRGRGHVSLAEARRMTGIEATPKGPRQARQLPYGDMGWIARMHGIKANGAELGTLGRQKAGQAIMRKIDALQKRWKSEHYGGRPTEQIEAKIIKLGEELKQYKNNPTSAAEVGFPSGMKVNPTNPVEAETYDLEQAKMAADWLREHHHTGVKIVKRARHSRYPYTSGPTSKPGRKNTQKTMYVVTSRGQLTRNPATASAEVFEEFHGFPPSEVITVKQKVHHHTHVAAAGELAGLQVKPINRGEVRTLQFGDDCFLTFNEKKTQLFITGGDQRMSKAELKRFGVTEDHELHTIGKLITVGYFTDKTHLGDEGGEAVYSHTFRTTNENGKHITVKIARYPDLIYRALDEQFEISGGSYEILREGIDK